MAGGVMCSLPTQNGQCSACARVSRGAGASAFFGRMPRAVAPSTDSLGTMGLMRISRTGFSASVMAGSWGVNLPAILMNCTVFSYCASGHADLSSAGRARNYAGSVYQKSPDISFMFHGSMVALVTPMHLDGGLDTAALRRFVGFLIAHRPAALLAVGTTG